VQATSLRMQEAALTGESEAVLKDAATLPTAQSLGDRLNMVVNGTAVVQGQGEKERSLARQRRRMATAPLHSGRQARQELDNRIAHRLGLFFMRDVAAPVQRQQFGVRNPALQFE
jgi:hypothetical protein